MLNSKKWLFMDVGNVICNDDPVVAFIYKKIHNAIVDKGHDLSFEDLLCERDKIFNVPGISLLKDLVLNYLSQEEAEALHKNCLKKMNARWFELSPLLPGAKEFIQQASRQYHLGIIANQPPVCQEVLEKNGLLNYFKVVGLSDVVGMSKPDSNFFNWALRKADTTASESVMVGDRVDNDVKPAKSLGFKTVHFKMNVYEKAKEHIITEEHQAYLPHVNQFNISMREAQTSEEQPDFSAVNYTELSRFLLSNG